MTAQSDRIASREFQPGLSFEHLSEFLMQLRSAGMPEALLKLVEPWTEQPRQWHPTHYGLDTPPPADKDWLVEFNGPLRWQEFDALESIELINSPAVLERLTAAWDLIVEAGAKPALCANLRPSRTSSRWEAELVVLSALGPLSRDQTAEIAAALKGQIGGASLDSVFWWVAK